MLSTTANNKPVWPRLLSSRSTKSPMRTSMYPNELMLRMITHNYPDDEIVNNPDQRARIEAMKRISRRGKGVLDVQHVQKSFRPFVHPEYSGAVDIGRAYMKGIPMIPGKARNTCFKMTHSELDITNSYATILLHFLKGEKQLTALSEWVNNRHSVCAMYRERYGIPESAMKVAVSAIICSYPSISSGISEKLTYQQADSIKKPGFYVDLLQDLKDCYRELQTNYPGYCKTMVNWCKSEGKERYLEGMSLMYFAQDVEYAIVRDVMENFTGLKDVYYNFDGIIFPTTKITTNREEFQYNVESYVREQYGIPLKFKFKDLAENSFAIALSPDDMNGESYLGKKIKFEQEWAFCNNPVGFMRLTADGQLQILNKDKFMCATSPEAAFVKEWVADTNRLTYDGIKLVVPPRECPTNIYNIWSGLAADKLDSVPSHLIDEKIARFKKHVHLLCGGNDDYSDYIHKLFALKIQRPDYVPRVMVVFRSLQGTGKDVLFGFLEKIFGSNLVCRTTNFQEILGTKNNLTANKCLICVSEASYKDNLQFSSKIKNLVTGDFLHSKILYQDEGFVPNYGMVLVATNEFTSFAPTADDRRLCIFTSKATFANDPEYFHPLLEDYNDPSVIRAIYQDYMEMDVSEFDPSAERPKTETFEELAGGRPCHMERFIGINFPKWKEMATTCPTNDLKKDGQLLRISNALITDAWEQYALENSIGQGSRHKDTCFRAKLMAEFTPLLDKHRVLNAGLADFSQSAIRDMRAHGKRFKIFEVDAMENWIEREYKTTICTEDRFGDFPDEVFDIETSPSKKQRINSFKAEHNKPGEAFRYVVKDMGEVVFLTNDLEEINKFLGEAYIKVKEDGTSVLVHQKRDNMEFELTEEYLGELGKTKLEAKYPWYKKSRIC